MIPCALRRFDVLLVSMHALFCGLLVSFLSTTFIPVQFCVFAKRQSIQMGRLCCETLTLSGSPFSHVSLVAMANCEKAQ